MTDQITHADEVSDLQSAIGESCDERIRLRCIELAIAATPRYTADAQTSEVMLTARRFADFAILGTSTWLVAADPLSDQQAGADK